MLACESEDKEQIAARPLVGDSICTLIESTG